MPIVAMQTSFNTIWGSQIWTTEINFPPMNTFAVTALAQTSGGGTQAFGIVGIRTLPRPDGPEVSESFGDWPSWPPEKFSQAMTSITFGMATGKDQRAKAMITLFFWQ